MIFSATVPNFIQEIAKESMDRPVMLDLVGEDEN
jgi:superfamily II DNA/RNA helicase